MTDKEILYKAMQQRGFTQTMLAELAGMKRQSNISRILSGAHMRTDSFVKLLDVMGYDVIIKDRNRSNKDIMTLTNDANEPIDQQE